MVRTDDALPALGRAIELKWRVRFSSLACLCPYRCTFFVLSAEPAASRMQLRHTWFQCRENPRVEKTPDRDHSGGHRTTFLQEEIGNLADLFIGRIVDILLVIVRDSRSICRQCIN
jgi:hypothetical protein